MCHEVSENWSRATIVFKQKLIWFSAHLFSTDHRLLEILRKHNDPLNLITFSSETLVHPFPITDFERTDEFIVQSTASQLCTFGITVEVSPGVVENVAVTEARNKKKLANLLETLNKHQKHEERYKKKNAEVPKGLLEKIENTQKQIQDLEELMKS